MLKFSSMDKNRKCCSFAFLTMTVITLTTTISVGQASFNDLLIVSELEHGELVHELLIENGFEYRGRTERDKDGYSVDTWSYSNRTAWLEYKSKLQSDKETGEMIEQRSYFLYNIDKYL